MPKFTIRQKVNGKLYYTTVEAGTVAPVEGLCALLEGECEISEIVSTVGTDTGTPAAYKEGLFKLGKKQENGGFTGYVGLDLIDPTKNEDDIIPVLSVLDTNEATASAPDFVTCHGLKHYA